VTIVDAASEQEMEPGLYVLVPIGVASLDRLPKPVPLVGGVVFTPFEDTWKDELRRFMEGLRKQYAVFSEDHFEQFDKARFCLVKRFDAPGGGRPIYPAVCDPDELEMQQRARAIHALSSPWLRSFTILVLAGKLHFGCFQHWFGVQIPGPDYHKGIYCYTSMEVGWYGRLPREEEPVPVDAQFWANVSCIVGNLDIRQSKSRLTLAVDMFARAIFAADLRAELLWLWITLECLFSPSHDAGELSHQLCERAAVFLEPPGPTRIETYHTLRQAYVVRCELVHGNLHFDTDEQKTRFLDSIKAVEDVSRRSLLKILTNEEQIERFGGRGDGNKKYFEEQILNPMGA
jgi:hypothetical protein